MYIYNILYIFNFKYNHYIIQRVLYDAILSHLFDTK